MTNKRNLKKMLLLSYPRCGNTLMRYFLEFVTSQQTNGYSDRDAFPIAKECDHIFIDKSLPKIIKKHAIYDHLDREEFDESNDRLLLLLRNPMECLIRQCGGSVILNWTLGKLENEALGISHPKYFFHNINFYDNWKGEKHIFYYEDQITRPEVFWPAVNTFVGGNDKKLEEFMANLDWHLAQSRRFYGQAQTSGREVTSHSLKVPSVQREEIKKKFLLESKFFDLKEDEFLAKYNII